jgi:hypothetical protein
MRGGDAFNFLAAFKIIRHWFLNDNAGSGFRGFFESNGMMRWRQGIYDKIRFDCVNHPVNAVMEHQAVCGGEFGSGRGGLRPVPARFRLKKSRLAEPVNMDPGYASAAEYNSS